MPTNVLVPTMGAALIGVFTSVFLYGITTLQTFLYYERFWHKDRRGVKYMKVVLLWLLETVHAALACTFIFRLLVLNFDDFPALEITSLSDDVTHGILGATIFLVHCFYIHRLWACDHPKYLPYRTGGWWLCCSIGDINLTSLSQSLFWLFAISGLKWVKPLSDVEASRSMAHSDNGHAVRDFASLPISILTGSRIIWRDFREFHRATPYFTTAVVTAICADVIIAVSMAMNLREKQNSIKKTNSLLNRLIAYIISTGVLTSVVDIIILGTFLGMPNNLVYLCFLNFINTLYANSMLALLNARSSLRSQGTFGDEHSDITMDNIQFVNNSEVRIRPARAEKSQVHSLIIFDVMDLTHDAAQIVFKQYTESEVSSVTHR
ncbi:hypothetical protein MVEN_02002200 [Mycena venus]|uniref:DUF6534 domain-containing protein n=1 Tax=Mycena venus TaxID=2733690 RepID=A0A8H6XF11_9AGAR|nr:hypothetical protein MVEN_02002200 [Mycena venus]